MKNKEPNVPLSYWNKKDYSFNVTDQVFKKGWNNFEASTYFDTVYLRINLFKQLVQVLDDRN